MTFDRAGLIAVGFQGFRTIQQLRSSVLTEVPKTGGVYVVLREIEHTPAFMDVSTGGWFKGKNPTVSRQELMTQWVPGAHVIYIGKGDGEKGLQGRMKQYLNFGLGRPIGHWGGRLIWQIEASSDFVIAWRLVSGGQTARGLESQLLSEFEQQYGRLPFANLVH